ncbi:2-methoxy-6-polyprenyl-1,4-benzoquinol methylase, mitochondrial isoform X1 [Oryzias melastigma]|uniref:2-methoxy-6-polyprenyl-1,4-benzoquinol methylase, mitochondrial isoform X1 n=1 Tax=Oryzias melastigma TaxID=30732 RepID=UPI000CF83EEC|nr:2-methoxy-6-polyprenyl-1,4-benzoquinol methylase, mitochondrial isoform X1 [Oryzias melastigma]
MAASVRTFVRSLSRKNAGFSAVLRLSDCRWFSGKAEERSTHFGFETVSETEKASKVYKVFENVAQKYDVMNDAMSLGIHRLWKDALLHVMHPQPGARLLDVAGGTGDIAFRFLEYIRSQQERQQRRAMSLRQTPLWRDVSDRYPDGGGAPESAVVVCDINKEMLKVGRQRADSRGVTTGLSWVVGDAEELLFNDDQFDLYTIAFGIRNVTHIDQALKEALRVLKPGGRFLCLEFSKVTNPVLERFHEG